MENENNHISYFIKNSTKGNFGLDFVVYAIKGKVSDIKFEILDLS